MATVGVALVLGVVGLTYAWPIDGLIAVVEPLTQVVSSFGLAMDREMGYLFLFACPSLLVVGSLLPGI